MRTSNRIASVSVTREEDKQHEFRMYHKYEREEDKRACISALAAHYSYDEVTEDNYKTKLKEIDPNLWRKSYERTWDEIMIEREFLFYLLGPLLEVCNKCDHPSDRNAFRGLFQALHPEGRR